MHYIINPWVFYLLGVSNSVGMACVIFLAVFAIAFGSYLLIWTIECLGDDRYPTPTQILKKAKFEYDEAWRILTHPTPDITYADRNRAQTILDTFKDSLGRMD